MSLRLRSGAATHVGRVRSINQDSYLVLPDRQLFVVADGMGGHQGGEVASRLAIDALRSAYREPTADALSDAIAAANTQIRETGDADASLRGMGTTIVAAAVLPEGARGDAGEQVVIASVGDSRGYLYRDDALTQLTEDHSIVGDLLRDGRITEAEAEVHPQRNIVTRVLGVYDEVDVDLWPIDPVRGDRIVLCSDGLFNEVKADQITAVLRRLADPQDAAAELVRLANEGGGRDNTTVVVLDVVDDGGKAEAASEALAGDPSSRSRGSIDDPAGFATARDDEADEPRGDGRSSSKATAGRGSRRWRPRLTWRALAFTLLVLAIIGGAFATIQWYGTSTYYVGFHDGQVAIFRGRPGGLLWIDPTLEEDTGITRPEVPQRYLPALESGSEQASLTEAKVYVSNIERDIIDSTTTTTTTTTAFLDPGVTTTTAVTP